MSKLLFMLFGIFTLLFQVTTSVTIEEITVPSVYILNNDRENPTPLILDCIFEVSPEEKGFVLKWTHNNINFYQWLGNSQPTVLSIFKGHVDTTYKASTEDSKKYRAVYIKNPKLNMSGTYACQISTYNNTVKKTANLLIVVPESDFQLHYSVDETGILNIKCSAFSVSPRPKLTISLSDDQVLQITERAKENEEGLFDVIAHTKIEKEMLTLPTSITCVIHIPGTNYTNRKTLLYEPIPTTTTGNPVIIGANGAGNASELSRLEATSATLTDADNGTTKSTTSYTILFSGLLMVLSYWLSDIVV